MNGYKIVLLKAIFMLYKLLESERVCSGICIVHSPKASHIYDSIISIIIWEVINQCMCIDRLNRLNFDFF